MWPDEPTVVSSVTESVSPKIQNISVTVQEFRSDHHKQVAQRKHIPNCQELELTCGFPNCFSSLHLKEKRKGILNKK